jgi:hypothetical protein
MPDRTVSLPDEQPSRAVAYLLAVAAALAKRDYIAHACPDHGDTIGDRIADAIRHRIARATLAAVWR